MTPFDFSYSLAGFNLTKSFEGLKLTAYQDPVGIWTIGYGHTGRDVHPGMTITQAQAEDLLHSDLAAAVTCVNRAFTYPHATQCQFDALVDFAYNAGRASLLSSHLLLFANAGSLNAAAGQFGLWVHAGTQVLPGLVRRRTAEAQMFLGN